MFAVLTLLVVGSFQGRLGGLRSAPAGDRLFKHFSSTEIQSYERKYFYDGWQISRNVNCFRDQIRKYFNEISISFATANALHC